MSSFASPPAPSPSDSFPPPPPNSFRPPPPNSFRPPPPNSFRPPPPNSFPPPPPNSFRPPPPNSFRPPPPNSFQLAPSDSFAPPPSSKKSSTPLVAGVVAGVSVVLILAAVGGFLYWRKRKRSLSTAQHGALSMPPKMDDTNEGMEQHMPELADHVFEGPSQPPSMASSTATGFSYSASDQQPPQASSGTALGFTKNSFTYEELVVATDGFSHSNFLGQGGFGYVHKGTLPDGKEVAVKQLKTGSGQGEREFRAEIEIISYVHHKHLVSLVGYCVSGEQMLLVYEYVPNGTLEFHLHGKGQPTMEWTTRSKIALGAAKGLAYIHEDCSPKIIHRDIKAANILLDYNFEAKVADFGLAKFTSDYNTHVSTRVVGTFGYLAPEYAASGKLTERSDVFSFGVMLLELITGHRPFDSSQSFVEDSLVDWARPLLAQALEDGNYDDLVDPRLEKKYGTKEMSRMLACAAACVRHSARHRPQMSQIVRVLEGDIALEELNKGVNPGNSRFFESKNSDNIPRQYNEVMKKLTSDDTNLPSKV